MKSYIFFSLIIVLGGCSGSSDKLELFTLLPASQTNVTFSNTLVEDDDFNIMEYLYYYDGGGVAVGDVNNDGLKDLFFTANQLPNKLYLNKGGLVFEDISELAGIEGFKGWSTGVAMADVNGDGYLDIYVSQLGDYKSISGTNLLYINNGDVPDNKGDVSFTEKAAKYGVDHVGFSTQASFFDYDNDGDLDMYLLNHAVHSDNSYGPSTLRLQHDNKYGDKLFRNDSNGKKSRFTEVTEEAGIFNSHIGYGLAITAGDINNDGWIDIYISNDFHENDYLYINNHDGTFSETLENSVGHTSRSSMGNDLADFNNDGLLDIMVLDMLPDNERILKKSNGEDLPHIYDIKIEFGYSNQLTRNTLQLNLGNGLFSEIALLSGVYASDWSWAPLFCDLDNDGYKDLLISNGIFKRPNDLDYLSLHISMRQMMNMSSNRNSIDRFLSDEMPSERIPNKAFRNNGDLTFTDKAKDWGLTQPGFSNGAAYADLDNDGDLDLVFNNVNEEAFIYRNNSETLSENAYLQIKLNGLGKNTNGIGAKVFLKVKDQLLYQEQMPVRGFQSSVDDVLHFGIGQHRSVDTLQVIWPDGKSQILSNIPSRQLIKLDQQDATLDYYYPETGKGPVLFKENPRKIHIDYKHQENKYSDFNFESLMPHKLSTQGPKLAVEDVNGDGRWPG